MTRKRRAEASFLFRLRDELEAWTEEGILSPEQAGKIAARFDFAGAESLAGAERNRAVAIVTTAGAALLGLGVILFFAANWPEISRWGRFALVLAGMVALFGSGYEVGWRRAFPATGRALVVGGCLLYGAGIWLIAQTFNISSHEPRGLLTWALGILPLAAVLRISPLTTLFALLLVFWDLFEVLGFDRANPWFFPLAVATVGTLSYRDRHKFPVWVFTLGLTACMGFDSAHWAAPEPGPGLPSWVVPAVLGAWGGVMVLVGRLHDLNAGVAPLGLAWRVPGHLLLGSLAPLFTFHDAVREFFRSEPPTQTASVFLAAAAAAAVGLFLICLRRRREAGRDAISRAILAEAGVAATATVAFALLFLQPRGGTAWVWVAAFDLLYLGECAALIYLADRARVWWTGYLGVALFTAFVVCRYLEYAVRLLPKSFVFIAAGALLLSGGVFLERRRRGGGKESVP